MAIAPITGVRLYPDQWRDRRSEIAAGAAAKMLGLANTQDADTATTAHP
jgi:hypothetical protein